MEKRKKTSWAMAMEVNAKSNQQTNRYTQPGDTGYFQSILLKARVKNYYGCCGFCTLSQLVRANSHLDMSWNSN